MDKEKNNPIVIWSRLPWIITILIIASTFGILFYLKANEKWILLHKYIYK